MKIGVLSLALVSVLGLFTSCSEDDDIIVEDDISSCDSIVIIDSEKYVNAASDEVTVNNLTIEGDCLTVNFSASGCDGNSWITELIGSEEVLFLTTNDEPISGITSARRRLAFVLEDQELCEAFITQEVSFDISSLQVESESSVELIFSNSIGSIIYKYGSEEEIPSCDSTVVIDSEQYTNAVSDEVTVNSLVIEGDCLTVNFSASGCSGDTWSTELIDSEQVFFPSNVNIPITNEDNLQRNLSFILEDQEECEAFITQEVSFDISSLQVEGENEVLLNFNNFNESVLYEYGTEDEIVTCDLKAIKDLEQFTERTSDQVTINSLVLENDCLTVNFNASGCSGDTWFTELIDSDQVIFIETLVELPEGESYTHRNVSFLLTNEELCEAFIEQEVSFDISSLQVEGVDNIELFFTNNKESVFYEY